MEIQISTNSTLQANFKQSICNIHISDMEEIIMNDVTTYRSNNVIRISSDNNLSVVYTVTGSRKIRDYDSEQDSENVYYLSSFGGTATNSEPLTFELAKYEYDYTREHTEDFIAETVRLKIDGQTVFEKNDNNMDITMRKNMLNGKSFAVNGITYKVIFE